MKNNWQTLHRQQGKGLGIMFFLGLVCCIVGMGVALGLYQTAGAIWAVVVFLSFVSGFRGAVVGWHGSGKTMFLIELARRLRDAGHLVTELFKNNDGRFGLAGGLV